MFEIRLRVMDVGERESDPPSFLGIAEGFPQVLEHATSATGAEADLVRALVDYLERLRDPNATLIQLDDFPTVRLGKLQLGLALSYGRVPFPWQRGLAVVAAGPHTDIERFRSWVVPLLYAYPTVDARIFGYIRGGMTYNLYSKLILTPRPFVQKRSKVIRAHPGFVIRNDILPSPRLPGILDELRGEQLPIGDQALALATPSQAPAPSGTPRPPLYWHASRDYAEAQYWDGRSPTGEPVKRFLLNTNSQEGTGLVSPEDLEGLNSGLLRSRPRWLGVPDLMKRFLLTEYNINFHHNTQLSIELQLRCRQGWPALDPTGRLAVPVAAPSGITARKLKVNALLTGPTGPSRTREASVEGPSKIHSDGMGEFVARLSTKGASSAIIHVLLNDRIVDKVAYDLWAKQTPNPRLAGFKALDRSMEQMDGVLQALGTRKVKAQEFEVAVSNIFAAAGFVTFTPGRRDAKGGETFDILAIHPMAPAAFCVECTTGPANNQGKLGKLSRRAAEVSKAMPAHSVKPILVIAADEATPVEAEEASKLKVVILAAAHLRTLRVMIEWNSGPSAVSKWLNGGQSMGQR